MNKLPSQVRSQIIHLLCEGMAIRAISRTTGASKNTIAKLLDDVGRICADYHDAHVRGVKSKRVQVDEIWSFTQAMFGDSAVVSIAVFVATLTLVPFFPAVA